MVVSDREFGSLEGRVTAVERECADCRMEIRKRLDAIFSKLDALTVDVAVTRTHRSEYAAVAAILISVLGVIGKLLGWF